MLTGYTKSDEYNLGGHLGISNNMINWCGQSINELYHLSDVEPDSSLNCWIIRRTIKYVNLCV